MSLAKSIAYKALDFVTAGRGVPRQIAGETFRLPARWSRYYQADYEPETFEFLRRWCRPGDAVMDIGAHLGLFTVCMSRLVGPRGQVFSFEPTPFTCSVLRETVRLNHCESNVVVHQKGVSSQSGHASFFDTGDVVSNANSLVHTARSKATTTIETVSLDDVLPNRQAIRLLKIDVEGAELDVLRGAGRTINRCRPVIQLGLHPLPIREAGGSLEEIWDLLNKYRMTVFYHDEVVDRDWFLSREDLFDVQILPSNGTRGPAVANRG
jgi:FkbM family methyltransferase